MRSALFIPPFDELADPLLLATLAAEAEEAGWDGVFLWDHIRWGTSVAVADPWIALAAIAVATERIRIGPMITPLARRRPVKVARETVTLDQLSNGRLTLGAGLGTDWLASELSTTGEELDDRVRADMLDESLSILTRAWTGKKVSHHGTHYVVDGMAFLPRPVQRPGIPIWTAGFSGNRKPLRRAARHDGYCTVDVPHPDELAEMVHTLGELRVKEGRADTPFDVAVSLSVGTDPRPYAEAGATWWLVELAGSGLTAKKVRSVIRNGPA